MGEHHPDLCTCTLACIPQGMVEGQTCRMQLAREQDAEPGLLLTTGEGATTRENVNWLLAECGRLRDQLVLTEKQRRIFEELSKLNASERADKAEAERDALREELKTTRKNLKRATYIAEHLWQMVDQETWRSTGGDDGQGHYEGDYHA